MLHADELGGAGLAEHMLAAQSALGIVLIPLFAWLISERRAELGAGGALRVIATGLILQFALVAALLWMPWTKGLFAALGQAVLALQKATDAGAQLVFGYLAGAPAPFDAAQPQNAFVLAFRVLPERGRRPSTPHEGPRGLPSHLAARLVQRDHP